MVYAPHCICLYVPAAAGTRRVYFADHTVYTHAPNYDDDDRINHVIAIVVVVVLVVVVVVVFKWYAMTTLITSSVTLRDCHEQQTLSSSVAASSISNFFRAVAFDRA